MNEAVLTDRFDVASVADTALNAAARLWFLTAVIGQLLFVFYIASFYGGSAVRGNWEAWNRAMPHGYVPGDTVGNVVVAAHLFFAVLIILGGAIQLVPQVRRRAPIFHRWNGRLYMLSALTISSAGLYMVWIRGGVGDVSQHVGISVNALLIMFCAAMALRYAVARNFATHRQWALRLFLVVSGVWFFRVGLMLSFLVFKGPFGFDPKTFQGPFLTCLAVAQYLLPLGALELYLRTQDRAGATGRLATAAVLFLLTIAMGAGIFAATMGLWLPRVKAAYDTRASIAETQRPLI